MFVAITAAMTAAAAAAASVAVLVGFSNDHEAINDLQFGFC